MAEEQKPSNAEHRNQQIRHDLVNTATSFLLNPSVINKSYEQKCAFLRKKGLTEEEISLAYEKAESDPNYKQIQQNSNASSLVSPSILPPPAPAYRAVSFWSRLSRFSSSMIVLGVAVFGAHYVYKKYIEPLIYGEDKSKSENLEKQLLDMTNSLFQLERHVSSLEENIICQKEQMDKFLQNEVSEYYPTPLALRELKTEIAAVKSLLLNRHQFPALPKVSPSIPLWQLSSNENGDNASQTKSSESENLDDSKDSTLKGDSDCELVTTIQSNGTADITSEVSSNSGEFSQELRSVSPAS